MTDDAKEGWAVKEVATAIYWLANGIGAPPYPGPLGPLGHHAIAVTAQTITDRIDTAVQAETRRCTGLVDALLGDAIMDSMVDGLDKGFKWERDGFVQDLRDLLAELSPDG